MIYFDNAATTPLRKEVQEPYQKALFEYGNPDSLHRLGRRAHSLVEKSRSNLAELLGVAPQELIFTSSSSESNSLAIIGYALANQNRGRHIITSNAEHSSSEHAIDFLEELGFEITRLPVNDQGFVPAQALREALRPDTILVSMIHVNNETGAITPIEEMAEILEKRPTTAFHVDATQSFTKMDLPLDRIDLLSASAHKIHGLKGSAILYKKKNVRLKPLVQGGQQEQGLRGGTTNAPAAIVFSKTVRLALEEKEENARKVRQISNYLKEKLAEIDGAKILSPQGHSPYILVVAFDQITSEVLQNALDERDIYVSARSTCKSSQSGANPILLKMGASQKDATHAIRLSFSGENTLDEAKAFVAAIEDILRQYGVDKLK